MAKKKKKKGGGSNLRDNLRKGRDNMEGGGAKYWTPAVGKNRIIIFPAYYHGGSRVDSPYRVTGVHFNAPNGETVQCPRITNEDECRLCDAYFDAKKGSGDPEDEKSCQPRTSYVMNILDLDNIGEGVQVWQCPYGLMKEIHDLFDDPTVYDIDSPVRWMKKNPIITFKRKGEKKRTKYTGVTDKGVKKMKWSEWKGLVKDLEAIATRNIPSYEDTCKAYDGEPLQKNRGKKKKQKSKQEKSKSKKAVKGKKKKKKSKKR